MSKLKITVKIDDATIKTEHIENRARRFATRIADQLIGNGKKKGLKRMGDIDMLAYRVNDKKITVECYRGGTFEAIMTSDGS